VIHVNALRRGGLSVAGGTYDARLNVAELRANDTEILNIRLAMPETINTTNSIRDLSGIDATQPVLDGAEMTFRLFNFRGGSTIRFDVMLSTNEVRSVTFYIRGNAPPRRLGGYRNDNGTFQ